MNIFNYISTNSVEDPRPIKPKSSSLETKFKKRTHLVQCIQRVIIVFIKGPK